MVSSQSIPNQRALSGSSTTHAPSAQKRPSPTMSPTQYPRAILGLLEVRFSVFSNEIDSLNVTPEIKGHILKMLVAIFCENTDFIVLLEHEEEEGEFFQFCEGSNNKRRLESSSRKTVIVGPSTPLRITDQSSNTHRGLEWMQWTVVYPVLRVGLGYELVALGSPIVTRDPTTDVTSVSIQIMNTVATSAINSRIEQGNLNIESPDILGLSVLGEEDSSFRHLFNSTSVGYSPLEPSLLQPIRIVGMALLVLTIICVWWLLRIARKRKEQRMWDTDSDSGRRSKRKNDSTETDPLENQELMIA